MPDGSRAAWRDLPLITYDDGADMERLKDHVAAITGGARGIGGGIARRFLDEGARVAILDINAEGAGRAAAELSLDRAIGIACDVTSASSVADAVGQINRQWGTIGILVNCAGTSKIAPIEDTTDEMWDRTFHINLRGPFYTCRAVVPQMKASGWGRIINLSSQSGKTGNTWYTAYCASKFGVIGLTQALAQELAEDGITANAICPGIVFTDMWGPEQIRDYARKRHLNPDEVKDYLLAKLPMKRPATVEDVAGVAAFLASDDASYITGQSYNVTGGTIMH